MSIFGSLFTAVSGLSAQSQSIGMISNNIANVSTVGYKRTDAAFSSLVTSETRSTLYSPGSVRASQNARIDQQGILQQSSSSTDVAISGNGFFVVKRTTDSFAEPLYTRAGSFSEDKEGTLQNTSGFFLMGWPLDQNAEIIGSPTDVNSLVPINVAFLNGNTQATSTASLSINLDAGEDQAAYPLALPVANPNFTRDIRVYDSEGGAQDLTINFLKHASPTATATGVGLVDLNALEGAALVGNVPGMAAGDEFTLDLPSAVIENSPITTIAGSTVTVTIGATTTVADLLSALNNIADVNGNPTVNASVDENGHLSIKARNPGFGVEDLTLTDTVGTPLADMDIASAVYAAPADPDLLTALDPAQPLNPDAWWYVEYRDAVGNVIQGGSINFNGSGTLNGIEDVNGDINVDLDDIDWPNSGSDLQDITFNIDGFTQFAGDYNVVSSSQNGAALGLRTGVTIDRDGFVTAQFSNGLSTRIYKLAIATFSNTNGLDQLTGNVYRQSDTSGDYNLREAGTGSAGLVESGALEAANVDLADEFSKMIVTQRAYSANTKVISTADEMTAELLRLR